MFDWYQSYLIDTGRSAALWVLVGFVTTYAATRWITRRIRSRAARRSGQDDAAIRDVYIGGVHIHHQVWGILLVLVSACWSSASTRCPRGRRSWLPSSAPGPPWRWTSSRSGYTFRTSTGPMRDASPSTLSW